MTSGQKVVFGGTTRLPSVESSPWSAADIAAELRRVHAESAAYWLAMYGADAFFHRSAPEVWAPVDQVRHLTKSMRAIATGFELPRVVLAVRFGVAFKPSRDYLALRQAYEQRLGGGIRGNPFAPRPLEASEQTPDGRARVMQQHAEVVERLSAAVQRYPEWSLDRQRARHPLLGLITMRELALFALLHNVHHVHVAERRRSTLSPHNLAPLEGG